MSKTDKRNSVSNGIAFTGKSWSYVLRVPDMRTGKTKPKWVGGFTTRESALLARDEARVSLRKRNYVAPAKTTVWTSNPRAVQNEEFLSMGKVRQTAIGTRAFMVLREAKLKPAH